MVRMGREIMDVFRVRSDGGEELLASKLSSQEIDGIRERFCYTKSLGPSVKIVVKPAAKLDLEFSIIAAGQELDTAEELTR